MVEKMFFVHTKRYRLLILYGSIIFCLLFSQYVFSGENIGFATGIVYDLEKNKSLNSAEVYIEEEGFFPQFAQSKTQNGTYTIKTSIGRQWKRFGFKNVEKTIDISTLNIKVSATGFKDFIGVVPVTEIEAKEGKIFLQPIYMANKNSLFSSVTLDKRPRISSVLDPQSSETKDKPPNNQDPNTDNNVANNSLSPKIQSFKVEPIYGLVGDNILISANVENLNDNFIEILWGTKRVDENLDGNIQKHFQIDAETKGLNSVTLIIRNKDKLEILGKLVPFFVADNEEEMDIIKEFEKENGQPTAYIIRNLINKAGYQYHEYLAKLKIKRTQYEEAKKELRIAYEKMLSTMCDELGCRKNSIQIASEYIKIAMDLDWKKEASYFLNGAKKIVGGHHAPRRKPYWKTEEEAAAYKKLVTSEQKRVDLEKLLLSSYLEVVLNPNLYEALLSLAINLNTLDYTDESLLVLELAFKQVLTSVITDDEKEKAFSLLMQKVRVEKLMKRHEMRRAFAKMCLLFNNYVEAEKQIKKILKESSDNNIQAEFGHILGVIYYINNDLSSALEMWKTVIAKARSETIAEGSKAFMLPEYEVRGTTLISETKYLPSPFYRVVFQSEPFYSYYDPSRGKTMYIFQSKYSIDKAISGSSDAKNYKTYADMQYEIKKAELKSQLAESVVQGIGYLITPHLTVHSGYNLREAYQDYVLVDSYEILSKNPKNFLAHFNIGVALFNLGLYDKANDSFKKAIEIYPEFLQAYAYLGSCMLKTGDFQGGEKMLQYSLSLDPPSKFTYVELLAYYKSQGRSELANNLSEKYKAIFP